MSNPIRVLCFVLLGWVSNSISAQTMAYTSGQIAEIVTTAFRKSDFATLDRLGTEFRTQKTRAPSGSWSLEIFHSYLKEALLDGRRENSEEQWQQVETKISRWMSTTPDSVVAPILLASAQLRHGFLYRGHGFANTVTPDGWRQFSRYVSMSMGTLEKHKHVSSVDPEWYVLMMSAANHVKQGSGKHVLLYEEALKREPLYNRTYIAAADGLLPKWGGSMEQVNAFVVDAVRRTSATEGNALYARIYWAISDRDEVAWDYIETTRSWDLMKSGFEDVIKRYPHDWNKNAYAKYACKAGDVDTFIRLAREFDGKPFPGAWPEGFFQACKSFAAAIRPDSPI